MKSNKATFRNFVLWLTGRDLLKPPLLKLPQGVYWTITGPPPVRWEMMFSADAYMKFALPSAPNVLHRLTQRIAFGIRWRMIPVVVGEDA